MTPCVLPTASGALIARSWAHGNERVGDKRTRWERLTTSGLGTVSALITLGQEGNMTTKQLLMVGASALAASLGGLVRAEAMSDRYVRIAELDIDPAQLESYTAAVKEEIKTSVRVEPGVLALYAVADREHPTHITVFEVYTDVEAYKAHLETPHFKQYKATTQAMVTSLKLVEMIPILLSAKAQ